VIAADRFRAAGRPGTRQSALLLEGQVGPSALMLVVAHAETDRGAHQGGAVEEDQI
jgi:hypothetical protein